MDITTFIQSKRVYLDGAMGTNVIKRGYSTAEVELYNFTSPSLIKAVHNEYLDAGSNVIFTNTFGCNSIKYDDITLTKAIRSGIALAKECAKPRGAYVCYSVGPLTEMLEPFGKLSFDKAYGYYREQAEIVVECKPDAVVLETFTDLLMLKAALLAFKEHTSLPVFAAMSFEEGGRTFTGASVGGFALTAQALGADAIGINCSLGAKEMFNNAKELIKYANVPIYVKPNAGLPKYKNGATYYDVSADEYAEYMVAIAGLGVSILGGCCGTDGEYIKKTIEKTRELPYELFHNDVRAVCSASEVVEIKAPLVIGERINPTGKPRLKLALANSDYDYVAAMAVEQTEKGAHILDINVGLAGIDETEAMKHAVKAVQSIVNTPLSIDSTRTETVEAALRLIVGVPIINSVNGDDEILENVLPLAAKYGAYVICLCLDKNGIPSTAQERLAIADRIMEKAAKYGIPKSRLLIDALTMAVSVDGRNALITLDTVKKLTTTGYATVLGLSNVSFGLPLREVINASFYKQANSAGLVAAIINPNLREGEDEYALRALSGEDVGCAAYVEKYAAVKAPVVKAAELTLFDGILKGLKGDSLRLLDGILTADNYLDVINGDVIGALTALGERYEKGLAYLPQLIAGADCAKAVLDVIKSRYLADGQSYKAVMLLATVKGDVHDIGKNIVKAVLSNYGYRIIDLGKDVPTAEVLRAIDEYKPQIVGLSALMTTTLDNMKECVAAVRAYDKNIIIMVGGAVVTKQFADGIGANYSKDAQEAVRVLNTLTEVKK